MHDEDVQHYGSAWRLPEPGGGRGLIGRLVIAAALAAAGVLASVPSRAQEDQPPWKIAIVGPMSGEDAHLGRAMVDAAQLRLDEINAAGGIGGRMVEIVEFDDGNDAEKAAKVAEDVARNSNALVVLGHRTSGASVAAASVYQKFKMPAISGTATADELTADSRWYYRVVYNNGLQADFIANYINSILRFKHTTLIATDSVYAKSLADAFRASVEELPLEITHSYDLAADDPDIDLNMAEIIAELSLVPDSGVVFLAMSAANAAHFVREMRNSGFTFPLFGADSINQNFPDYFEPDPVLKTSPGDFTDQTYATTSMIWDVANESAVRFRTAFLNKHGRSPDSAMGFSRSIPAGDAA